MSNKMALDALKKIAAMDAEGVRADDLGRAAVVARAAIAALEAERLAAQSAPTGLTDMGWVIDAATKGELAAYDQGIAESIQAVTKILDGKDAGAGIANRPWEPLRRRLLALVAQSAPLAQQREYPPLPVKECAAIWPAILDWYGESPGADTYEKSHAVDQAITAAMRAYVDAALAAAQVEPSAPPAPGGDVLERRSETGMPMSANAPEKCPITRRPFFMVISHPELGWVPTYGGPYDSYTIPHMEGKPDEPYHERELTCHHYDHDYGGWVDDESIPMRVINEGVLNALQSTQAPTAAAQGQTPSADIFANAIRVDWNMEPSTPDGALELLDAMDAEYAKTMGKPAPDDEMAQSMRRVRHMACDLWAWQKDEIRAAFVALQQAQGQDAAPAEQPQDDEPTWQELEDFRKRHWTHWNAADNLLIAHLAQKLKCAARPAAQPGAQEPAK